MAEPGSEYLSFRVRNRLAKEFGIGEPGFRHVSVEDGLHLMVLLTLLVKQWRGGLLVLDGLEKYLTPRAIELVYKLLSTGTQVFTTNSLRTSLADRAIAT